MPSPFPLLAILLAVAPIGRLWSEEAPRPGPKDTLPAKEEPKGGDEEARPAAEAPAGEDANAITVRLVTDHESGRLVSEIEKIEPVVKTIFDESGSRTETLGERATLWVRNANVDGKFFFERYHKGKYINRSPELKIGAEELGAGDHFIGPGRHRFTVAEDGAISSEDPEISIKGRTVSLKLHKIIILAVDGARRGPPEFRLVPAQIGLFLPGSALRIERGALPAGLTRLNPARDAASAKGAAAKKDPKKAEEEAKGVTSVLSHARDFYPLSVYLPSNQEGYGYVLYPSWQAFHVSPTGEVDFAEERSVPVPGVVAEGAKIVISYRTFSGRLQSKVGLKAFVGRTHLRSEMKFSPTLESILFTAGLGRPSRHFFIPIDNDFSQKPNKLFLADNSAKDPHAVRLLAMEWGHPVLTRGEETSIALRFIENAWLFRVSDIKSWDQLLLTLKSHHEAKEDRPGKAVLARVVEKFQSLVVRAKPDQEPGSDLKLALVEALNGCLLDHDLIKGNGFEAVQAPEPVKSKLRKAGERLSGKSLAKPNRVLISAAFPTALRGAPRQTVPTPTPILSCSPYNPHSPSQRKWTSIKVGAWKDGVLSFRVPEVPYGFYYIRAGILDIEETASTSPLSGEFFVCIVSPGQTGTASVVSNKGRDAFVAGEEIGLEVAIRSASPRPKAEASLVLRHPNGRDEKFAFEDAGGEWATVPFSFSRESTRSLRAGRYSLSLEGLSETIAIVPFSFDLVPSQRASLFKIVKPSKYTRPMNNLVASYLSTRAGPPYDLERAVGTLAELGYNRIDLMTYTTDLHSRTYTMREALAEADERLMAPESVYQPSPRNQLLNACVRHGIEFSDVLLSYNDFHLPRYIEGYIEASKRWVKREVTSMRHSPALAGMMLYDEMYSSAVSAFPDDQPHKFSRIRQELAREVLGEEPSRVESRFSRYLSRPRSQRDPKALEDFLRYRKWELRGWGDYNTRVAAAARQIAPQAQIGTYHRTWMGCGKATGVYNGYPPDLSRSDAHTVLDALARNRWKPVNLEEVLGHAEDTVPF